MESDSEIELENHVDLIKDGEAVVESVCMSCRRNGTTRILATKIPHFNGYFILSDIL